MTTADVKSELRVDAPDTGDARSYEEARSVLERKDAAGMRVVAADHTAHPEMLFYLAASGDIETRVAISTNPSTPYQADEILCGDHEDRVRMPLIGKMVGRLAGTDKVDQVARGILRRLANDQSVAIRQMLAEEIKASDNVPVDIVHRLARDSHEIICCPVLENSPLLDDTTLIGIITEQLCTPALSAIARREAVSEEVADHIAGTSNTQAISALLVNSGAQIREQTLNLIAEAGTDQKPWHEPLALRPILSARVIEKISTYIASDLLKRLSERNDLDSNTTELLSGRLKQRLESQEGNVVDREAVLDVLEKELANQHKRGKLDAGYVAELAKDEQHMAVWVSLGILSGTNTAFAYRIFSSGNAKAVCALVWVAGLPASLIELLQSTVGGISEDNLLLSEENDQFPLTERELNWQLELFGYQGYKDNRPLVQTWTGGPITGYAQV